MKILTGKQKRAVKVVIYGTEGIGKSTFAQNFPDPLFLDLENGTSQLDVKRVEWERKDWKELIDCVGALMFSDICKTIVIDTADAAEMLCVEDICTKNNKTSIEDFGYGKGYQVLAENYNQLIKACNDCVEQGKNVVIIAHSFLRKQELPDESGAFDRYEMKLSKKVAPLLKEWADMLLFFNYKTDVYTDEKTKSKKARGAKRIMYTTHTAVLDAKNRFGLPDEMPMDFAGIAHIFETPQDELKKKINADGVDEKRFLQIIEERQPQFKAESIAELSDKGTAWAIKYFDKIIEMMEVSTNG